MKIAIVSQRYGNEVNGGAELLARQFAEKMTNTYDIEVLTTCAIDYVTWKNEYHEGIDEVNGITVRRFPVEQPRNNEEFNKYCNYIFTQAHLASEEVIWMEKQGPFTPKLIEYIKLNENKYHVFIFVTYLYYTTYMGIQMVPHKSIMIPNAHDEPTIHLDLFKKIFHLPRAILFNTVEEKDFIHKKFKNVYIPYDIGGVGVEVPNIVEDESIIVKFNIHSPYIVYVGRIEPSKGCDELFEFFLEYKRQCPSDLKLVLIGKPIMDITKNKDIISLGFVSDEDKFKVMKNAELLVLPSQYESLSMVILESFKLQKPVLVNGKCEVLKGHMLRSNGGLYYTTYNQFKESLQLLIQDKELNEKMGKNGEDYTSKNYNWDNILERLNQLIKSI